MPLVSIHDPIGSWRTGDTSTIAAQQVAPGIAARIGIGPQHEVERGRLATILVRILEDADEAIYRDREAAKACIARASAILRDEIDHDSVPATLVRGGLTPWQMKRVKAHVEAHLDSTIRMRDLSEITGLSTCYFSRSFTHSFGVAPGAYVARCRLARAQELMLTTADPLSQIAVACGFCDQSHLTRLFRRHFGTSPNVWRRRHSNGPTAPSLAIDAGSRPWPCAIGN